MVTNTRRPRHCSTIVAAWLIVSGFVAALVIGGGTASAAPDDMWKPLSEQEAKFDFGVLTGSYYLANPNAADPDYLPPGTVREDRQRVCLPGATPGCAKGTTVPLAVIKGDTAPAEPAPTGFAYVTAQDAADYKIPTTALVLTGDQQPPAGYSMVQKSKSCTSLKPNLSPNGGPPTLVTEKCGEPRQFAIPSGTPEATPTEKAFDANVPPAPSLNSSGSGEGGGTYGFDAVCERMSKNKGSWLAPTQAISRMVGNVAEQTCKVANVVSHPSDALSAMWKSSFGKAVKSMISGVADGWGAVLNWWFTIPTPKLAGTQYLTTLQAWFAPIQVAALTISLMIASVRIAMAMPGGETAESLEVAKVLMRSVFAIAMLPTFITLGTIATDAISLWLIREAGGDDLGGKVRAMLIDDNSTWGPGWVLIIAIMGLIGAITQAVLLVIRQAFLMVIVGVIPIAATASGSSFGRNSFETMRNWAIAFVLFKLGAASIMACALWASDPTSDISKLQGLILLTVAAVSFPALLRVIGVSNDGAGGGGGSMMPMLAGGAMALASGGTSMAAKAGGAAIGAVGSKATGSAGGGGGGGGGGYAGPAPKSGAREMRGANISPASGGQSQGSTSGGTGSAPAPRVETTKAQPGSAGPSGSPDGGPKAQRSSSGAQQGGPPATVGSRIPQRSLGRNEVPS